MQSTARNEVLLVGRISQPATEVELPSGDLLVSFRVVVDRGRSARPVPEGRRAPTVDTFDCVAPTRMGRNNAAFTSTGRLNPRNASHRTDDRPIEDGCGCYACRTFSRAYIRHLVTADEMLGPRLLSLHNVHFLIAMMRRARAAIADGTFGAWSRDWLERYNSQHSTHETT